MSTRIYYTHPETGARVFDHADTHIGGVMAADAKIQRAEVAAGLVSIVTVHPAGDLTITHRHVVDDPITKVRQAYRG